MSTARLHAEWLSLLEISGPFLSLPVLLRAFPQGLEAHDPERQRTLRLAYDEWRDNQGGLRPDPALHTAWVRFVLGTVLEHPAEVIREGQAILSTLMANIAEQGETLRPDLVLANPAGDEAAGLPRVLIQVYPATQDLDRPVANRRWKASPATRMMELLHATEVRLGLVTNGERWMLVDAPRGETTGFVSWFAEYWLEEPITVRAFRGLLGAQRLFGVSTAETLETLLAESAKDQHEVTDQLGYQVRRAVEVLVHSIDRADQDGGRQLLADITAPALYEAALTVMMRLVFLFSAEERSLLLLGDPLYDQHYAVSTLRAQLREAADQHGEEVLERRFDAWCRLLATFRAVYAGVQHENLRLPAYGGSLFDPDRFPFLEGRVSPAGREQGAGGSGHQDGWRDVPADPLPINNRVVLHLLDALQMLQVKLPGGGPAEARRLSFRSLDIEQIGHVYEGLLDHTAVRAAEPVLGLAGTKDKEPEVALAEMERWTSEVGSRKPDHNDFVTYLRDITGRSESALRRALDNHLPHTHTPTPPHTQLRAACANDDALYHRVLPFAGLLRDDDFGLPVVIRAGSVYVTAGTDRRSSGTHYTPRSLTEPIVQHTLEPLVRHGPAEGLPKDQWTLKPPADLLVLKVCDMAMGSGAFLVQVCRYLSERLVEAWEAAEVASGQGSVGSDERLATGHQPLTTARPRITPEGQPSTGAPGELLIPTDADERLAFARRLVADRCLYGVDKNPLAVEMAKLSLWLITLDRNRPFTFLDHALKCGDSLVGADEDMFLRWAHGLKDSAATLFDETLRQQLETARAKRRELESFEVREVRDAERKAALLAEADTAMERIKQGCDLLIGTRLLGLKPKQAEARLNTLLLEYFAKDQPGSAEAREALTAARNVRAFHWPFEFPEVFERGGFGAFVGNPPFLGGKRISSTYGDEYLEVIKTHWSHTRGSADICAYFFLRAYENLSGLGCLGLVATNTISQADTREVGLNHIVATGGAIYRAVSSMTWPGVAAVFVSLVHLSKGAWNGRCMLDGTGVARISAFLDAQEQVTSPFVLMANDNKSHMGTNVFGEGFRISIEHAQSLIAKQSKYQNVLFPFLNGVDINTYVDHRPAKWVINFHDWPLETVEREYPEVLAIVKRDVWPLRAKSKDRKYREEWWLYARSQNNLYEAIKPLARCLVIALTSDTLAFVFTSSRGIVFSNATIVIALEEFEHFALLQSTIHTSWARKYGSTMKGDARYTPTDCFQTFPFPDLSLLSTLRNVGDRYYSLRQQTMLTHQEGLTTIYNRFHDPDERSADIARLRELHVEIDKAVAAAYGWDDLDLGHGFYETPQRTRFTLSELARREVLARLLRLNHERYEAEVAAGIHEKGKGKKVGETGGGGAGGPAAKRGRKKKGEGGEQMGML